MARRREHLEAHTAEQHGVAIEQAVMSDLKSRIGSPYPTSRPTCQLCRRLGMVGVPMGKNDHGYRPATCLHYCRQMIFVHRARVDNRGRGQAWVADDPGIGAIQRHWPGVRRDEQSQVVRDHLSHDVPPEPSWSRLGYLISQPDPVLITSGSTYSITRSLATVSSSATPSASASSSRIARVGGISAISPRSAAARAAEGESQAARSVSPETSCASWSSGSTARKKCVSYLRGSGSGVIQCAHGTRSSWLSCTPVSSAVSRTAHTRSGSEPVVWSTGSTRPPGNTTIEAANGIRACRCSK